LTIAPRFLVVLRLLNNGLTDEQIGKRLGLSVLTVRDYLGDMRPLFRCNTRYELVRAARRRGVIPTPRVDRVRPVSLTTLETRIITLARQDLGDTAIARSLRKTRDSVKGVFANARRKLGASNRYDAIDKAHALGLITGPTFTHVRNPLSERECEIIEGLDSGLSRAQIGAELGISRHAVQYRIILLRAKLRVNDDVQLLDAVYDRGFHRWSRRPRKVARAEVDRLRAGNALPRLTPRLLEVLDVLVRHPRATFDDLARRLTISPHTLGVYAQILERALGASNRVELVVKARVTLRYPQAKEPRRS